MNVHGTHAQVSQTDRIAPHAKPSGTKNDCHIGTAQFAHLLTQLMDKSQASADAGTVAPDATTPVKTGR